MPFVSPVLLESTPLPGVSPEVGRSLAFVMHGACIALCQWLVLRRVLLHAWWWIVSTLGGVLLFDGLFWAITAFKAHIGTLERYNWPLALVLPTYVLIAVSQGWYLSSYTGWTRFVVLVVWSFAKFMAAGASLVVLFVAFLPILTFINGMPAGEMVAEWVGLLLFGAIGGAAFGLVSGAVQAWLLE